MKITIEIAGDGTAELEGIDPTTTQGQAAPVRLLSQMPVTDVVDAGAAPVGDQESPDEINSFGDDLAEAIQTTDNSGDDFSAGAGPG